MPNLLIIDFGSSGNYGDKMVGQVVRQHLALQVPDLRIRNASSVVDAQDAGWWYLDPDNINPLLQGIDHVLLLGGSIFFGQVLKSRGVWWVDELEARGLPLTTWGGLQHTDECYDYPTAVCRIIDYSQSVYCRFEGELPVLEEIYGEPKVVWGSDPLWCRPRLDPLPGKVLTASVTAPYKCNGTDGRNVKALSNLLRFVRRTAPEFEQYVVLKADPGVMSFANMGIEVEERVAGADHWLEAHAARGGLLVTTRLHPTLYSLACGVPVLAADFADKVTLLMEQVGMGQFVFPLATTSTEEYTDGWGRLREEWGERRVELEERVAACRHRAHWTMNQIAAAVVG